MTKVYLDFETRSRINLRKTGLGPYVRHNSTVLLCMAWAIDDGDVELWLPGDPFPYPIQHAFGDPEVEFHAHNANFERQVWRHICVPRLAWPVIKLTQWHCSAALAAAAGLPRSLDKASKALNVPINKDLEGNRLMLKYTKPRQPTKTDDREWHDDPRELDRIYQYCMTDVLVEREIVKRCPELHPRERLIWLLDQRINDRGVPIDTNSCLMILRKLDEYSKLLEVELKEITGGAVETGSQIDRMLKWLQEQGVAVDSLTAESVDYWTPLVEDENVKRVLQIRRQLSRSSTKKFSAMIDRADGDSRVRDVHLYYGAHTGRWAGRGLQTQNIPRGGLDEQGVNDVLATTAKHGLDTVDLIYGDVTEALTGLIRPMICAPEGRKLIACDFAAIEARVLAWLAGEEELLADFRIGRDVYKSLASRIYHVPIDQVTKSQRQMGKQAILGLGYGMGARTFQATCEKYKIEVDDTFAQDVVDLYRATYPKIRRFWYRCEEMAITAVQSGVGVVDRRVHYRRVGDWLKCILPAGRAVHYYQPRVDRREKFGQMRDVISSMVDDSMTHQWVRRETYGGRLVENIVQAVARDLLADAMFRLEKAGYSVIFHVHDEAVVEVDEGFGSAGEVEHIMSALPAWAHGCPVGAEGFEARRYRK